MTRSGAALPAVSSGAPLLDVVHHVDCLTLLKALPDGCINCVVTSPPYFGLRDYGVVGQIGLEPTPQQFVATMVAVFREVRRVLRDDGTCWLNLGDSYAGGGAAGSSAAYDPKYKQSTSKGIHTLVGKSGVIPQGYKPKDLMGIPWRVAFALQDDGWYLRSDIIWHKPNPMPESVTDRPTKAHEYVFLLSKSERYWYDADAIREEITPNMKFRAAHGQTRGGRIEGRDVSRNDRTRVLDDSYKQIVDAGRNRRSVWTVPTEPNSFAHFATFPRKLIEPMILAGCPDKVCSVCGAPWVRVTEREQPPESVFTATSKPEGVSAIGNHKVGMGQKLQQWYNTHPVETVGFEPTCDCNATTRPGVVLDPFMGSGTTGLVARANGRHYIGSELNADYVAIAKERLRQPFEAHHVTPNNDVSGLPLFEGLAS